jgi:hypothetical protein
VKAKGLAQLCLRGGLGNVDLIAEDEEGDGLQIVGGEETLQNWKHEQGRGA